MPLPSGTRLGAYEIHSAIGAGGMGEVYRARDTRLGRDVALKVLPEAFAADADRVARFGREAHALAALNHPNIAHLYGFEEAGALRFLVLELVAGDTLADRLAHGPIPLNEAVAIARQIADALEAAHERGVIHRDLKPANVKLRDDGTVKVLDFGLAAFDGAGESVSGSLANSPTLSARATEIGMILGTAAYMSPEQAKGKAVDRRADVWAFGVVLFEMITGRRLFTGDTASEVLASVIKESPDWSRLPASLPEPLHRLLRRCLEKDPKNRLASMSDARLELNEPLEPPRVQAAAVRRPAAIWLAGSAVFGAAVAAAGLLLVAPALRPEPDAFPRRVSVLAPEGVTLFTDSSDSAISPDGRSIVFRTVDGDGGTRLWVRRLDTMESQMLAGTEQAFLPFWSPDSRQIAFFADGKLKKLPAAGGSVEILCDARDGRGGSWGTTNVIVFAPSNAGPLHSVSASGGDPQPVTVLDTARGETGHRFPSFLPDGRRFLYAALPQRSGRFDLLVGSLDGATRQLIGSADGAAVYADQGYLLFPRQNTVVAQRFDAARLATVGEPVVVADAPAALGVQWTASRAVSVSATGALAYLGDRLASTRLQWLDRTGRHAGDLSVPDGRYIEMAFAPDGRRVSLVRQASVSEADIWIADVDRGGATRFTFGPGVNSYVAWSPDGTRVAFSGDRKGPRDLFMKPATGATPEEPLYSSAAMFKDLNSWSPDGKSLLFYQLDPQTNGDLWLLPSDGNGTPVPYLRTPFNEQLARISPDGRWVAYTSDESGRDEIYVDAFPAARNKYRVTDKGGLLAAWRNDGRELAILDQRTIQVAEVTAGPEFRAGPPRQLLTLPNGVLFTAPTPDMQRFLVSVPEHATSSITVVFDWQAALAQR